MVLSVRLTGAKSNPRAFEILYFTTFREKLRITFVLGNFGSGGNYDEVSEKDASMTCMCVIEKYVEYFYSVLSGCYIKDTPMYFCQHMFCKYV